MYILVFIFKMQFLLIQNKKRNREILRIFFEITRNCGYCLHQNRRPVDGGRKQL